MFDELKRELGRLHGRQQFSVALPSDADGYYDRECPSPECLCQFKVHEDDWRDKVRNEEVFCAFCGHAASSDKWFTQEQIEHAKAAAIAQVRSRIGSAMRRDAQRWNSRQSRSGFLRITMSVKDGPRHHLIPIAAAEPMRLRITCPQCSCRYAAVGAAFFCPACGHNAADLMFHQTLAGIRATLDALPGVRAAIPDRDTVETTARLVIENGLQNAVTAFQRYAEALHEKLSAAQAKPRRNAFQNLIEGSNLWKTATGKAYEDYLSPAAMAALARLFQQRHLLAHTQGVVDQDYLTRSGDTAYRVGQRIVVRDTAVRTGLQHIESLASGMARESP
ncbi:MAG: hypothetical protein ABS36_08730 [Acidobacteria bacterium SCN 69-37]|nr:MAG: hypothetical protein ABS36_08730 [Acidobacteria bacterium SCN 69-37]